MCVLLVHHRVRADAPVVLLANRDEAYARPFEPPSRWPGGAGIVAPRDALAGGTWLGVNARGLVAAITNRPTKSPVPGLRSRGLLVADLLARGDAAEARAWLSGHLARERYNPFNLLLLDRARAFALERAPEAAAWSDVSRGTHVLTNLHDLDAFEVPPQGRARAGEPLGDLVSRLETLAADRTTPLPGDHRICKVGRSRGTVCSAVLALPADAGAPPAFRFAAGPPHATPFRDAI